METAENDTKEAENHENVENKISLVAEYGTDDDETEEDASLMKNAIKRSPEEKKSVEKEFQTGNEDKDNENRKNQDDPSSLAMEFVAGSKGVKPQFIIESDTRNEANVNITDFEEDGIKEVNGDIATAEFQFNENIPEECDTGNVPNENIIADEVSDDTIVEENDKRMQVKCNAGNEALKIITAH